MNRNTLNDYIARLYEIEDHLRKGQIVDAVDDVRYLRDLIRAVRNKEFNDEPPSV